mgnify:CR=1 FL=1
MCGSRSNLSILGKRLNAPQGKNPISKTGITTTIVKCQHCSLIFSNPQPIPQTLLDHYGVPPESYWNDEYFRVEDGCFQHEINTAYHLINKKEKIVALDVGAGIGKSMIAMQKAGVEAYGIEPSSPFYERAISKMDIHTDRLVHASIETALFPSAFFDFINFGAVLEHLYDPSQAIIRALTWLKPSGVIHVEVPSSRWLVNKIANFYYRSIGTDYVANLSPMHIPFHLYEFSVDSFRQHGRVQGYEVALCEYFVCQTYMPPVFDRFLRVVMDRTKTGMQLGVWLRKK